MVTYQDPQIKNSRNIITDNCTLVVGFIELILDKNAGDTPNRKLSNCICFQQAFLMGYEKMNWAFILQLENDWPSF
jgi:hypothetical protein